MCREGWEMSATQQWEAYVGTIKNMQTTQLTSWTQFAARPFGYRCPAFENSIRSYCDEADPFCAKGNSSATHQGYGQVYGQDALEFVMQKLSVVGTSISNATRPGRDSVLAVTISLALILYYILI